MARLNVNLGDSVHQYKESAITIAILNAVFRFMLFLEMVRLSFIFLYYDLQHNLFETRFRNN